MNNRIADIESQCWEDQSEEWAENVKMVFNTTKFAELIIRECAKFQVERSSTRHGYDKHEDGPAILKHFGIEKHKIHQEALAEYVQVPVEPTDEMYGAGYNVLREIHTGPFSGSPSLGHARKVFQAMIAASQRTNKGN